ncbi:FIST signal transduction protein [Photobacterium sp. 1_MG-2023]|uniref:FIST signal transduction protein n=1 Tax=Photobacterium sp. 1_MG-2023 TaxID=3062646 RepID=UPI0026E42A5B|nr:FIST N-terminal domain-containing protein [Photobacterium sp. 1_MG-2023]MDO6705339.1 FIST N-terminal domain-containing protein [Photobacterium sp. 1_MG-2023]
MEIVTSYSTLDVTESAIGEAVEKLKARLVRPSLLLVYFSGHDDAARIRQLLTDHFPDTQILGCSSCQGILTDQGYFPDQVIGLWAVFDFNGAYGSALVSTHQQAGQMARQAVLKAIQNTGRSGELPSMILLHASPGAEEEAIEAISQEFGTPVPIIGGSAADTHVSGQWQLFTHDHTATEGVAVSVFYPSCEVSFSFHSGYAKTELSAVATKIEGREILELDHRPAKEVYEEWIAQPLCFGESIMSLSALHPLGRVAGNLHGLPYFKLAHPNSVTERGGITLFASIKEGERFYLMTGTEDNLINRAGRNVDGLLSEGHDEIETIGGISIYCAGCMLQVKPRMAQVADKMRQAMREAPYICPFTFGEQGQFIGGENEHGNLMISKVLFYRE